MKKMNSISAVLILAAGLLSGCAESKPAAAVESEKTEPASVSSFVRGPETAKLKIEQFSDFFCPYCKKQAAIFNELREKYPDQIQMTFRHFPLSGEPGTGTFPLHEAAVCAAEQGKFWEFHDYVFQANERVTVDSVTQAIALNDADLKACMQTERGRSQVLGDLADAQTRGVNGAPTFFMNGEKITGMRPFNYFAEKLDPELSAKLAAERKARKEELESRINFTEAGRPAQGPEQAPVTIVEFSDFHCFFCQKLNPSLDQVMQDYPGKIRRVWRHFPLPIHPQAPYAHVASECAHAQGKFWEFHNLVFANPSKARTTEDFKRMTGELGLDQPLFDACYENEATKKIVENDVLMGFSKSVGSTPSLLINGELFVGAKPIEKLKEIIERKMTEAEKVA